MQIECDRQTALEGPVVPEEHSKAASCLVGFAIGAGLEEISRS